MLKFLKNGPFCPEEYSREKRMFAMSGRLCTLQGETLGSVTWPRRRSAPAALITLVIFHCVFLITDESSRFPQLRGTANWRGLFPVTALTERTAGDGCRCRPRIRSRAATRLPRSQPTERAGASVKSAVVPAPSAERVALRVPRLASPLQILG